MSVTVAFTVPGDALPFGRAMRTGGMRAELDRVIPLGAESLPFFWVEADADDQFAEFEDCLGSERGVGQVTKVDSFDGRRLYRVSWNGGENSLLHHLESSNAALLEAAGDDQSWEFKLRFDDQDALSAFHESVVDAGVTFDITGVSHFVPEDDADCGLTPRQRETLVRAHEVGLYEVPRAATTGEVADDLGISDQALSERLRRAHATLIENTLL